MESSTQCSPVLAGLNHIRGGTRIEKSAIDRKVDYRPSTVTKMEPLVYILNARTSTFLLGAESLAMILLSSNAWGIRSYIPILNSRSKGFRVAGWFLLLFLCIVALAVTLERRPWGFLKA